MRRAAVLTSILALAASMVAAADRGPITVGAIYPTRGPQGSGGIAEYRGVMLAAEFVGARGGIDGRDVRVVLAEADSSDHVPAAMASLLERDVPVILGSHGSTLSRPAAKIAQEAGVVFWETGAVGELGMTAMNGDRVFRFPPTGASLGRTAVSFAREQLLPKLGARADALRYSVAYVDDDYGRAVGEGALAEIRDAGLTLAAAIPYRVAGADYAAIVERVAEAGTDVLLVSAYLEDGIALRRETVRQRVPLVASVGTSSSYCMHEFGEALGANAVGLFASDKPDGHVLDPAKLRPEAAEALVWAREEYRARFDHEMAASALTGFAGALALFEHVLLAAEVPTADAIAAAARTVRVPAGGLPNGSGLAFGRTGTDNLRATSVIWEWVAPGERAVVWPPAFATQPILPLEI